MPTYTNIAESVHNLGGMPIQPGQSGVIKKYLYPANPNFELTAHGPAPWRTLYDGSLPATLTGLAKYGQIVIVNDSGATISVTANEDTSNVRKIQANREVLITQDREIDRLDLTGSGSVYVYGLV